MIYTGSPLGLIDESKFRSYSGSGGFESILSSYQSKGKKHFLKTNKSLTNNAVLSNKPHSNVVYDVSTSNIISQLKDIEHLKLEYADFAYLKDYGVFPNNRLIVCRRFPVPVVDDLYSIKNEKSPGNPISTVLGYSGETEDFMKLSFNEEWDDAEISFKDLLNSLGKDFGFNLGGGLGSILEGASNVVPLPGATLLLQRKIMAAMGLFGNVSKDSNGNFKEDSNGNFIDSNGNAIPAVPQGDPNLIKQAKNRTLIGEDNAGSGLSCKINITCKTIYEQKIINGVDSTIVFMDILNNALNMGTSPASFYLGKQNDASSSVSKYLEDFMNNPMKKIKEFIESIIKAFSDQIMNLQNAMKSASSQKDGGSGIVSEISSLIGSTIGSVKDYVKDFIKSKYKIKFIGIINALTGGPSTPWHITIGNPLRPTFCSGDMLCKSVNVNFGPQLSFNDLPTFIEVEVQLESARNLGLQEIFAKFNNGGLRTTSGTFSGEYIAGIADSFWNTTSDKAVNTTNTNSNEQQPSDNLETTNIQNISSTQSLTKVSPISSTSSITPSADISLECNSDPNAAIGVSPAGSNSTSDNIRTNNTQDMTGSTDGVTNQNQQPVDKENSGIDNKPYTSEESSFKDKKKYTYDISNSYLGSLISKKLVGKDENGNIIYTDTQISSISNSESVELQMIENAKNTLGDK